MPIEGGTPTTLATASVDSLVLDCENVYWAQAGHCGSAVVKMPKP